MFFDKFKNKIEIYWKQLELGGNFIWNIEVTEAVGRFILWVLISAIPGLSLIYFQDLVFAGAIS